jgi:hypothetical protein
LARVTSRAGWISPTCSNRRWRGELKTIAATTWSEYKKYFEKDAALSRRFQLVKVSEPNANEATIILRGLSAVYEQSHGVLMMTKQAAATLSERYLSGRSCRTRPSMCWTPPAPAWQLISPRRRNKFPH